MLRFSVRVSIFFRLFMHFISHILFSSLYSLRVDVTWLVNSCCTISLEKLHPKFPSWCLLSWSSLQGWNTWQSTTYHRHIQPFLPNSKQFQWLKHFFCWERHYSTWTFLSATQPFYLWAMWSWDDRLLMFSCHWCCGWGHIQCSTFDSMGVIRFIVCQV